MPYGKSFSFFCHTWRARDKVVLMTHCQQMERFTALVEEHQASLRAFVRSLGVRMDWVDDLAQDAFVVAHGELDNFDQERDFGKWLRGIARNLVRNELRKSDAGSQANLIGWIDSVRDHGGILFIDLRDREGKTQLVFDPENKELVELFPKLKPESVWS